MHTLASANSCRGAMTAVAAIVACAACSTTTPPAPDTAKSTLGTVAQEEGGSLTVPESGDAGPRTGFATRHAYYEPTRFRDLPGWSQDPLDESWDALRRSCQALGGKEAWQRACAAMARVNEREPAAVRRFFETHFSPYQIRNTDRSTAGTLTGYYEPLLNGSKTFGGNFTYPVYGVPEDILLLDARRLPPNYRSTAPLAARIEGRNVVPLPALPSGKLASVYALDLSDSVPDIRDKKIRLRLDGGRIVPYYTRSEIERGALKAPILCYVDDPAMLYSMHLQGVGKIRMRDGSILRLAYAEQNGRPFKPPVASRSPRGRLVVRGVEIDLPEASEGDGGEDEDPASPLLTRGFVLADSPGPPVAKGANSGRPGAAGKSKSAVAPKTAAGTGLKGDGAKRFSVSDPSYVFFRPIPDSPGGPIGALGVPLSAGRSVAVDPRTTPLGAPVFLATRESKRTAASINRLMLAQDTGGAIRGAVRADYFYGFGPQAQALASRTNTRTEMWVLLPNGLKLAAQAVSALRVRGGSSVAGRADCLVDDAELCVDDSNASASGLLRSQP